MELAFEQHAEAVGSLAAETIDIVINILPVSFISRFDTLEDLVGS